MKFNPDIHHRKSIRLKNYDYAKAGAYFVTICTYGKNFLFGHVTDSRMVLNEYGRIVEQEWLRTAQIRQDVELDAHIIMPNHFHAILIIHNNRRGVLPYARTKFRSPSHCLGAIVRGFKSAATNSINQYRNTPRLPVWQRNYYEHVVRNENDLNAVREYILYNPAKWADDEENPDKQL